MKVLLIGKTQVDLFPFQGDSTHHMPGKAANSEFEQRVRKSNDRVMGRSETGQELIEFAGRLCYESFDLPNPDTAKNDGYVRNIVGLGHESVLEHVSVTFYVEGVSRSLTHELIRHRHLSFSELSQRYVDMEDARYVIPPAWRGLPKFGGASAVKMPEDIKAKYRYNVGVTAAIDFNNSKKQVREAARAVLPNAVETKLVVSGNLRAWRDVLKKRLSPQADAEMQLFAKGVWEILSKEYPDVFADITDD